MWLDTDLGAWKQDVNTGYRELFGSYDMIDWRWFVTVSFPRMVGFEVLEAKLKRWIKKVERRFPPILCSIGVMVKGNDSCHAHLLCYGKKLPGNMTDLFYGTGELSPAGEGFNDAIRFWVDQNKANEQSSLKWSDVNFVENYVAVGAGKKLKRVAISPEQKQRLLKMRAKAESDFIVTAKPIKESSIIQERDGALPGFVRPARESSIVIEQVFNVLGVIEYMTARGNLQIKRDEHSELFVYRPGLLAQSKRKHVPGANKVPKWIEEGITDAARRAQAAKERAEDRLRHQWADAVEERWQGARWKK